MQKPKHNHLSDKAVVQFGQRPGPSLECDDIIYYKVTYYSKVPSPNRILYMEGLTGYTTHKPYADLCAAVPGKVDSPYTNLEPWTVEKVKVKDIREYVQSCDEFNSTQIVSPFYEFSWNSVDGGWRGLVEQPSRPGTITANCEF
jgi:hypothetical protein